VAAARVDSHSGWRGAWHRGAGPECFQKVLERHGRRAAGGRGGVEREATPSEPLRPGIGTPPELVDHDARDEIRKQITRPKRATGRVRAWGWSAMADREHVPPRSLCGGPQPWPGFLRSARRQNIRAPTPWSKRGFEQFGERFELVDVRTPNP